MINKDFETFLEELLGAPPENIELYKKAFTHPSHNSKENYERLEFLGDAVVSIVTSHYLYFNKRESSEGELTRLRMGLVRKEVLAEISNKLGLKDYILLGKGEELDSGREKDSILSDVFEAFIGALYIDKGFTFVLSWFQSRWPLFLDVGKKIKDYKSMLQEYVQGRKMGEILYKVIKEDGAAHKKQFFVELLIDNKKVAEGKGKSKKIAEQEAARQAYGFFSNENV